MIILLDNQLVDLILNGVESRNIEFKKDYDWNDPEHKAKLTKAVLAMSNIRDGGYIILGVEEQADTFTAIGLPESSYALFDSDQMMAHFNKFADPYVNINLYKFIHEKKRFVVIHVNEFDELPVVCKRNGAGNLTEGAIYTRSNRMPETVSVPSQTEMREILDIATQKGIRKFQQVLTRSGLEVSVGASDKELFAREVESIDDNILEIIRSNGYWKVTIHPTKYVSSRFSTLNELDNLIESNKLRLRGWSYPKADNTSLISGQNFRCSSVDYGVHKEYLRIYQSGQLVHLFAMNEDWEEEIGSFGNENNSEFPDRGLEILNTVYRVSEIIEFTSRLISRGTYGDEINVKIGLYQTNDRQLFFWDRSRDLSRDYICNTDHVEIVQSFDVNYLIGNSTDVSLKICQGIFERFNWMNVPMEIFKDEQRKFLEGRL